MFSTSYVIFKIETKPQSWEVTRRYNDFSWLKELLHKAYPGLAVIYYNLHFKVPPIPKKTSTRSFQDTYLEKRKNYLEVFKEISNISLDISSNSIEITRNEE